MAAVTLFYVVFAAVVLGRHGAYEKDFGWQFKVTGDHYALVAKDESLREVDGWRLVAINGDTRLFPIARDRMIWLHRHDIAPGQPYTLRVSQGTEMRELTLTASLRWQWELVWHALAYGLVALSFAGFALFLGFLRPEDGLARLAALAAFATSAIPCFRMLEPVAPLFSTVELAPVLCYGHFVPDLPGAGRTSTPVSRHVRGWRSSGVRSLCLATCLGR